MSTRPLLHSLRRILNAPRRLARGVSPSRLLRGAMWAMVVTAFEVLGRYSPSDWIDGIGVVGLLCCTVAATEVHKREWLLLKRACSRRMKRILRPWNITYGIDLRGSPPLPLRFPWRYGLAYAATLLVALSAWSFREFFPTEAREFLRGLSGFVYLALLAALWSLLFLGMLGSWMGLAEFLKEILRSRLTPARLGPVVRRTMFGLGAVALVCAAFVPLAASVFVLLGIVGLYCGLTLSFLSLRVTWRCAGDTAPPAWSRLSYWEAGAVSWGGILFVIPVLIAAGDRMAAGGTLETGATAMFGLGYAWSQVVAITVILGYLIWSMFKSRLMDPGRSVPIRVVVAGLEDAAARRRARSALATGGLRAVPPAKAQACDLHVRIDESTTPEDTVWQMRWPLAVRIQDLADPELHERLERRSRIQRRRLLLRGLKRIFKHAASRDFEKGQGYWVAPHLWFITHLSRDTDETPMGSVGPPYRQMIPLAARRHMHEVLDALEIDLIFLEDGVGFRRFKRVLGALFEYYDIFGAKRLEEGLHFAGLPGVRVAIHDFELEQPLVKTGYPEPDYEDLGRARILHVFRDRGGDEKTADEPLDTRDLPSPVNLLPVLF